MIIILSFLFNFTFLLHLARNPIFFPVLNAVQYALVRVLQRNRIDIDIDILKERDTDFKQLAYIIMEAGRSEMSKMFQQAGDSVEVML